MAPVLALVGRTLVVLGGAYLLRALTEERTLPAAAGVASGMAYALAWLAMCARAARNGATASAAYHGFTSALVAFPLTWEATIRFALLGAWASASAIAIFTTVVLLVASNHHLHAVAWAGALGATGTAASLAVATSSFVPYTIAVVGLSIGALWLGYLRDWVLIRWPVALVADLMVFGLAVRSLRPDPPEGLGLVVGVQLLLLASYLCSFVARTIFLGREVIPFEVAQSAAAMLVGLGGASAVLHGASTGTVALAALSLAAGTASYAFAYGYVEPRGQWKNVFFHTSLAAAFLVAGIALLVPGPAAALAYGALSLGCTAVAWRSLRLIPALHALVYGAATAVATGLVAAASSALGAPGAWPALTQAMFGALAVLTAAVALPARGTRDLWDRHGRALRTAGLGLLAWLGSGTAVALSAPAIAGVPGQGADAGWLATLRTGILVVTLLAVACIRRVGGPAERGYVVYAMLALTGLKFLVEDLPRGRPATLFLAFALYGAALILGPRLVRERVV
jgi:hypothetical protein